MTVLCGERPDAQPGCAAAGLCGLARRRTSLASQFEAIAKFAPEEKQVIKALLEGMILKHEAKRWSSAA